MRKLQVFAQSNPNDSWNNLGYWCSPGCLSGVAEGTIHFRHGTPKIQAGSNLQALFLWSSSLGTRRCYESFQRREPINSPTQLWHLSQQWSAWQDIPKMKLWHSYLGKSSWTFILLNRKEIMPSTRNLISYQGWWRTWIFKENLLLPLY